MINLHVHRPRFLWFLLFLFVVSVFAVFLILTKTVANFSKTSHVSIGDAVVRATIADTPEERRQGLSGVATLKDGEGMIFFFSEPARETFWMKDMLIPIDIIWIRSGVIVGIEESVPYPLPGTPDVLLPRYTSNVPIDTVLEVPAGFSSRAGIAVGDKVEID